MVTRPDWESAGTFNKAWAGCELLATWTDRQTLRDGGQDLLQVLARAHVANLGGRQFDALPESDDDLLDYQPDPHLPFSPLYVSIGPGSYNDIVAGFLYVSDGEGVAVLGFWDMGDRNMALPILSMNMAVHSYQEWVSAICSDGMRPDEEAMRSTGREACKVLRFIESANVELDDTPVSRQVRRAAARKKIPIAMTVKVREPKLRRNKLVTGGETHHIEFSHRFEVAGHYAHYPSETRLFRATERDRPHKILDIPGRGRVVRIWIPEHVKGPPDKVLIPKTRIYAKGKS